jgi:predicted CoA-binding protein
MLSKENNIIVVNYNMSEIDFDKCYPTISSIGEKIDGECIFMFIESISPYIRFIIRFRIL